VLAGFAAGTRSYNVRDLVVRRTSLQFVRACICTREAMLHSRKPRTFVSPGSGDASPGEIARRTDGRAPCEPVVAQTIAAIPPSRATNASQRTETAYDLGMAVADSLLSLDDVQRARERIGDRLHRTPLLPSATMSTRIGADVCFKAELFQRTGSFKPRGVLNKLATLSDEEKRRGVISISAGNHAQALAYASALEGIDALIVMWQTASQLKIRAARGYGATVDDSAPDIPSAFERLDELVESTGRQLIHPYDDPLVMAGQGTVGLEIVEDAPAPPDVVLVQVGGGGLVSGIATAVRSLLPQARVVAVEPQLSRALHESLKACEPVTVEAKSAADGLNGPYAGANCVRVCLDVGVESVLVTEEALFEAFRFMYTRTKLACELAGAATAAALLSGAVDLDGAENIVAVVSGGNVDPKTAAAILGSDQ